MSNIRLAWNFPTDSAALNASSQVGNMLAANVQNDDMSQFWRTNGKSAELTFTFPIATGVNTFAIYQHNLSPSAIIELVFLDELERVITTEGLDGSNSLICNCPSQACEVPVGRQTQILEFFETIYPKKVIVRVTDLYNTDLYLQIARLIFATYWQPGINIANGYSLEVVTNSKATTNRRGGSRVKRMPQFRRMEFVFPWLEAIEELTILSLIQFCDLDKTVLVCVYPHQKGTSAFMLHSMLAQIERVSSLERTDLHFRKIEFTVREAI